MQHFESGEQDITTANTINLQAASSTTLSSPTFYNPQYYDNIRPTDTHHFNFVHNNNNIKT